MAFAAVILAPLFLKTGGLAMAIPMLAVFWLDALVHSMGVTVSVNGGVDAFSLVPPNALGMVLIAVGSTASLAALIVGARWMTR